MQRKRVKDFSVEHTQRQLERAVRTSFRRLFSNTKKGETVELQAAG